MHHSRYVLHFRSEPADAKLLLQQGINAVKRSTRPAADYYQMVVECFNQKAF
ncbi:MAG: hypothetical protein QXY20_09325 [Thermofilum sp.]|uniref:hypothetical protein n=1 Tax=Thermofilum sp. TaxID=1961369 RepID=UPI0031690346